MDLPDFLIIPSVIIKDESLQNLDGYVYAVVYWFRHLKMQKCILSNNAIGELLSVNPGSIANSLTRLRNAGFIDTPMDENNHRLEIVPLVTYGPSNGSTPHQKMKGGAVSGTLHQKMNPPSSNDEQNKIDSNKNKNKKLAEPISLKKSTHGENDVEKTSKPEALGSLLNGRINLTTESTTDNSNITTEHQAYGVMVIKELKLPTEYKARVIKAVKGKDLYSIETAIKATKAAAMKNPDVNEWPEQRMLYFFKVLAGDRKSTHNEGVDGTEGAQVVSE